MKLYIKWRYCYSNNSNDRLSVSYQYNKMFKDYVDDWVIVKDLEIQDNQYLWAKRFAEIDFDGRKITIEDLEYDLRDLPNHIRVLTLEEAQAFLEEETNLEEIEDWVFEISPEREDEMTQEIIPQKTIDFNL